MPAIAWALKRCSYELGHHFPTRTFGHVRARPADHIVVAAVLPGHWWCAGGTGCFGTDQPRLVAAQSRRWHDVFHSRHAVADSGLPDLLRSGSAGMDSGPLGRHLALDAFQRAFFLRLAGFF